MTAAFASCSASNTTPSIDNPAETEPPAAVRVEPLLPHREGCPSSSRLPRVTAPATVNTSVNATPAVTAAATPRARHRYGASGTAQVGGEQGGRVHQVSPPQAGACR